MESKVALPLVPWKDKPFKRISDKLVMKSGSLHSMGGPTFYPGLYSRTGYDILTILASLASRPNPQINIGAVDGSVALVLCDLEMPDQPIVYASESFSELTGYSNAEIIGQNCRFLQKRIGGNPRLTPAQVRNEKAAAMRMKDALDNRREVQLNIINYKKSGKEFINCVSIIPIQIDSSGHGYAVGFAVEIP